MIRDPRDEQYARLIVETCLDVQPGWQVLLNGEAAARPLVDEIARQLARRGAYALVRPALLGSRAWLLEAPLELLGRPAEIEVEAFARADALIAVQAPENTRDLSAVPAERHAAVRAAYRPAFERIFDHSLPWVGCQYPTPALAQDAGMPTEEFADFLYAACLRDWDAERRRMARYAERFEAAEEVRIVGEGTDIRLSIAGRPVQIDAGGANLPGGEFFMCPLEDSAEGEVAFTEYPAVYQGRDVAGVRLRFRGGRVVDASAESNEGYLLELLDGDEGARRLGELGIGCNPAITRHMRNVLFDEKIDGTVHLALGNGMPNLGGTNTSAIHWDIVKDLRPGGRIELDGVVVQRDGVWDV